jgi:lactocepin
MKNTSLFRRFLSVVLVLAMVGSLLVPAASAETTKTEPTTRELELIPTDASALESLKLGEAEANDASVPMEDHALTDVVRVSIVLDKASTLDAGFSTENIANNAAAMAYREGLRADQAAMTAKIEQAIGGKLDVQWNLTLAANIISANVTYGKLDAIKAIDGVKEVFVENRYEPQTEVDADEPNNGSASYMIGSNITWANGYTGAGSKVAIIDTGADTLHQSFSGEGLEYAFAQTAEEKGMTYDEYVASLDLLTAEKIEAVKGELNANIGSGEAAYRTTKIPYGYNYVDKNVTYVDHDQDTQGEHGSHVSGISTANRFIKVGEEYKPALEAVGTQGVAPDAQLVVMKVFGKGGGAYDSDYMVAIEDAIVLGCDSANLSLGSGSAGFSFSAGYEAIMNKLIDNGMVVAMSAGNSYGWYSTPYDGDMYPYIYMDDVKYDTAGSPGSFTNSLTVASVDNMGQTGMPLVFGDRHVFYSETSGYGNEPIATIAGQEYEYVLVDGPGVDDNDHVGQEGDQFMALGSEVLTGKIAMCYRGSSSFFAKANAAVAQGAIGVIIINNQAGTINMNLTGYSYTAPAVSILKADGDAIKADSEAVTDGETVLYYKGTMSIAEELEVQVPEVTDTVTVSEFSSYGMPGTLVLKPEILAPGGSIYSVNGLNNEGGGHDQYEVMSGTSMASPQVAGMAAIMGQYIRENGLCEKTGLTARQLINSLLMSTAHPVYDANGEYWPVFRVGAGLGNVADASAAQSYILMDEGSTMFPDSAKDGKVKAELGDDPDRTGEYSYKFTVNPIEGTKQFTLRTDLFLQDFAGNAGYGLVQNTATRGISSFLARWFGISDPGYEVSYVVNGETYENAYRIEADVNGDGETNEADAQAILDHVAGELAEDAAFDAEIADVDGDGKITTYDAHLILQSAATPIITANGPTEVTVNIKLTDTAKEVIDYLFNAAYIQGYTYVDPVADEEGSMDVVHSIPILAFYGSWTDASMLDRTSVIDNAYGTGKRPYFKNNNINYMTVKDANGATVYMGNPYAIEDKFPVDRLAMNSETTIQSFTYMPIRNIATQAFAVTDEDGKVIYSQAAAGQNFAPYYYVNGATWQNVGTRNYNVGKTLGSTGVKEGDKVTVGFYALPEYYGVVNAKNNGEVATTGGLDNDGFKSVLESGIVGDGAGIKYTVTVDDTAPTVIGAMQDLITGNIVVKCSDNNYVAYVAVTNKSGSKLYFGTVPEQTAAGEVLEVPLNIEGTLPKEVTLLVGDYAGNEVAFKVNLGGGDSGDELGGTMLGFVGARSTTGVGSGDRVWEINPDEVSSDNSGGSLTGVDLFANINVTVTAAEYVNGYIFMAGNDGSFYVADVNAMDEVMMVGKYSDTVSTILDMAFNYRDKQLYVLGNNNKLYTMDLVTGALTEFARLAAADSASANFNALAIDDDGNFYTANYGGSSAAKLYKFTLDALEMVEIPVYDNGWFFNSSAELNDWTMLDRDGDGNTFSYNTGAAYEGTGGIGSRWCSSANVDDWAISPAIDLTEYENAELSFWVKKSSSTWEENYDVYVGTTKNPDEMVEVVPQTPAVAEWTNVKVDLADYLSEEEVYVAIRHDGGRDQYYLYVDAVQIQGDKISDEPVEPQYEGVITAAPVGTAYLGFYNYSNGGGFAWDHNKGILYAVSNYSATGDYDHYLWIVNTETGVADRANTVGTGSGYSNISGRLYANVCGLIIIPGTSAIITPTDEATDLIVEPEEINMFKGQSKDITVTVLPWTLTDKDVTFASDNENVATVDDRGTVTSTDIGTATITVTTVAKAENGEPLTATVTVNVTEPPAAELRGIIWDENGKGQASVFNSNDTENWEALAEVGQLRWGALVGDMVYGSTDDTMYGFDADTYELETYGGIVSMWIPSDAVELPQDVRDAFAGMGYEVGPVLGPNNNGTYLTMMDPVAGSILYFNLSSYVFGSDPMATIAYAGRGFYDDGESTDDNAPLFYVMTESGNLYLFTMNHEGSVMWELVGETGLDLTGVADSTNQIWASSVYDAENEFLYVSHYDGVDDFAHLYAIDVNDTSRVGETGNFNTNVWPVTGLYEYTPATDLSLKVNPTDVVMFEGDTAEVKIKVKLGETNEYTAEIADPSIITFEDGVITGLKEGETTITVTTVDTNEAGEHLTETINVKVKGLKSIEAFVTAQVTDERGTRFTKISLADATASRNGVEAPGDVTSGGRGGDVYLAGMGTNFSILDAETFETTDIWNGVDSFYSQYPALDVANFPMFTDDAGVVDNHKFLFTTNVGWLVMPDYSGWNLSSLFPNMSGICFAGTAKDGSDDVYIYYLLTTDGTLYEIDIKPVTGKLSYGEILNTGISFELGEVSMAFITTVGLTGEGGVELGDQGIVIADNGTKKLWYLDFTAEDMDDVVCLIGTLEAENVSGLVGTFDSMLSLGEIEEPEPEPEPEPDPNAIASWSFETDPEADGWTFNGTESVNWYWSTNNPGNYDYSTHANDGTHFIMSASFIDNVGAYQADNWAISPAVALPAEGAKLSFYATNANAEYPEPVDVYVGTSTNTQEMTLLSNLNPTTGYDDDWTAYEFDLSDYAGQTVYIAFHDSNYDGYEFWLDTVKVISLADTGDSAEVPAKNYEAVTPAFLKADLDLGYARMDSAIDNNVEMQKLGETTNAVVGGTNAAKAGLSVEPLKLPVDETSVSNGNVEIKLSEDVAVTNGLIKVTYDADKLTYVDTVSGVSLKSIHHEIFEPAEGEEPALKTGVIVFAYASADEIAAENVLATLKFTYEDADINTNVVVTTVERNDNVAVDEDPLVIEIGEDKIYNLVHELKDGDEVVIVNSGFNKALSTDVASEKYLAGKDVVPTDNKIVNPDADTVWTVRITEEGVKFEDAEGNTLTATLDESNKTGLGLGEDHNLWILEAADADATYYVKSADVTYSNKAQYLEYYSSKDYFSIYGLQTGKENMYTIQFYANREDEHDCKISHFVDLEEYPYGTPEHEAIEWAYTHGYAKGMDETHFSPATIVTRAQAMTFLYAVNGKPTDFEMPTETFSDVSESDWFYKYVMWGLSKGLTKGFPDGTFGPNMEVTRAQMLQFFYAAEGKPAVTAENPYTDVPDDAWYKNAAIWAYENGLEKGEDGVFAESTPCPRVTVVLYLYRYYTGNALAD